MLEMHQNSQTSVSLFIVGQIKLLSVDLMINYNLCTSYLDHYPGSQVILKN